MIYCNLIRKDWEEEVAASFTVLSQLLAAGTDETTNKSSSARDLISGLPQYQTETWIFFIIPYLVPQKH
jgi:hypothetical protein